MSGLTIQPTKNAIGLHQYLPSLFNFES